MSVKVIIFSRDRAMQLDGTLRSFFLHCQDSEKAQVLVLFFTSDDRNARQYFSLAETYHEQVTFVRQNRFRQDMLLLLAPEIGGLRLQLWRQAARSSFLFGLLIKWLFSGQFYDQHILFLVDDNIFVRDFYLQDSIEILTQNKDNLGFSLRLGENTNYCYPVDRTQHIPEFTRLTNDVLKFNWTSAEYDFGYPLELSSSIYRLKDVAPFILGLNFHNPNTLEEQMAIHAKRFRNSKPNLSSYKLSVTFCAPVNRVQNSIPNRTGESFYYAVEELLERFEAGERIKVGAYNNLTPTGCHQEVELVFERLR